MAALGRKNRGRSADAAAASGDDDDGTAHGFTLLVTEAQGRHRASRRQAPPSRQRLACRSCLCDDRAMEWSDEGIIIGLKPHGESAVILEAMTAAHGRHLGLVRGGRSQRMAPVLQPGNVVQLGWRARLDDHLGNYTVEALEMRAARFIGSAPALYGLNHLGALLRAVAGARTASGLHAAVAVVTAHLDQPLIAAQLIIRFELQVLTELGFGLDLSACAATGQTGDLTFVSPKSGRAVSTLAAAPYRDRLLPLPSFLGGSGDPLRRYRPGFCADGVFSRAQHLRAARLACVSGAGLIRGGGGSDCE